MHSFRQRRSIAVASFLLCLFICYSSLAGPVNVEQVRKASDTFLKLQHIRQRQQIGLLSIPGKQQAPVREFTAASLKEIHGDDGTVLAYIAALEPRGFIATSADTNIAPIIAYSFRSSFPADEDKKNPLYRLLKEDMKLRAKALAEYDQFKTTENNNLWNLYADEDPEPSVSQAFQQWPQENTTSTGGWLESTWDQDAPYNDFCPLDPVDANRTYVGCVATAMAQVINYHRQCNVSFDEDDEFMTSSSIDIDKDSEIYDFPSFEELNELLEDLRLKYSRQIEPNDTDVAALSFACGIATEMNFTSEGSGASPYDAQDALHYKFGFHSADMTGGLSHEFYRVLQENMINRLPVLLAVSPTDGYGGHAFVCDGYNTDGEYHLNFGWGSDRPEEMTEVWYHLPSDLPSGLHIVTEVILNIQPVPATIKPDPSSLRFYCVPGEESDSETLFIKNNSAEQVVISSISCSEGFLISTSNDGYSDFIDSFEIQHPGQEASINVKFYPEEAGGYYGILTIDYGQGNSRCVILNGHSFTGGTEIKEGEVSGFWTNANSPYVVSGDIEVPKDSELVIEAGVKVLFVGPYSMTIGENARLAAKGNGNNPIEFTTLHKDLGWGGLRFLDSGDDDLLKHCSISYARKSAGMVTDHYHYHGDEGKDSCGGAIFCYASSPSITNCKITNNIGDKGGALYCNESYPIISNTLIANNASLGSAPQCGGICTEGLGIPEIINCTIVNNSPGGIFTAAGDGVDMTNTIVWGNERYQIETDMSVPVVSFCDVQGGYPGQGNIDADPCFFEPSNGVGTDYDGSSANWMLQSSSPCINSGTDTYIPETDLVGGERIYSGIVDLGAYENQSDLPLISIAPAGTVDTGFVALGTESTIMLDITNTGKIDLQVNDLSISDANSVFSIVASAENHLLAQGETVQVEIGFTPTEERSYFGSVYINSTGNTPNKQIALKGVGVSGTIIPEGEVSGTWKIEDSPYAITGDISIPKGRTLTIEPGVVVNFAGHFGLTVGYRATLHARGTETEHILFTPMDTEEGWFGIRFVNSEADDVLKYCTIEYAKKPYNAGSDDLDLFGGGILCCGSEEAEPGYRVPSSPKIDHCLIANNHAFSGGGILCMDESEAKITDNTIVDNSAHIFVGGIYVENSSPTITNNVIAHNSALDTGGILNWYGTPSIINNTIVHNRPNGLYLGITPYIWGAAEGPLVLNNIIWENEIFIDQNVGPGDYDINFNDIQGGFEIVGNDWLTGEEEVYVGEGNIDVDPCFADPGNRDYHLKSEADRWDPVSQTLVQDDITSPCIDAGQPGTSIGSEPSPNGDIINMGAYGGTDKASKSPEN
ncbi:MAG: choice-of-anchor D domain-containing protein [Planctomycetes bacterium]|nr:choice-of-anchor D domain-containing protein [Planctomycetota bacterium]